jgi:ParB family chromosome partitioning protein
VANALRLLSLPGSVLELLRSGKISAGHARAVLSLKTPKQQEDAAQRIAALGLSVRQAELMCKSLGKEPVKKAEPTLAVDYVAECEKSLSKQLGRGVKIINGKRKGRFELEFYGQEDLQILLDALMKLKK